MPGADRESAEPTLSSPASAVTAGSIASGTTAPAAGAGPVLAGLRQVSDEDYALGVQLARGGMGQILKALDRRQDRVVAVKRPLRADDAALSRFVREARMAARLQHPGIVPVYEAGLLPSGEPFFAMQYVEGRNLGAVVRATTTLGERLALLPHLIAAADALAYAHDRGVVHRDLTPGNILVGAHGETLVIDWGVARDLGAPDATRAEPLAPALGDDGGLTATHGVVGTPRFMSPEQAGGAPADRRSDVYALGAVLYFVLGGQPPYAELANAAPRDVLAAAPTALARVAPEVPAELTAVVARAMARDPEARYPSAAELAADLKRFLTGELVRAHAYSTADLLRRWARRRLPTLAATLVAAVAVAIAGALGFARVVHERDAARSAERHAQGLSAGGEKLVAFLVDTIARNLNVAWQTDVLADLTGEVMGYYGAVAGGTPADAETIDRRVWGLETLSVVEGDRGDKRRRGTLARAGLTMLEDRTRRFGSSPRVLVTRGHLKMLEADAEYFLNGLTPAAIALYEEARADTAAAAAAAPDDQGIASIDLDVQSQLCTLYTDANVTRARFVAFLERSRRAHAHWPENDEFFESVGWSERGLARTDVRLGRYDEAAREAEDALAVVGALAIRHPDNGRTHAYVADTRMAMADIARARGRPETALRHDRAAIEAMRAVARDDPNNLEVAQILTSSRREACAALRDLDRPEEALAECRAAIAALGGRSSDSAKFLRVRAETSAVLADALIDAGRGGEAERSAQAAIDDYDALIRRSGAPQATWLLWQARTRLALCVARRDPAMLAAARAAAPQIENALERAPGDLSLRLVAADAFVRLGDIERRHGTRQRAVDAYRRAAALAGDNGPSRARGTLALAYAGLSAASEAPEMRAKARSIAAQLAGAGSLYPALARALAELEAAP